MCHTVPKQTDSNRIYTLYFVGVLFIIGEMMAWLLVAVAWSMDHHSLSFRSLIALGYFVLFGMMCLWSMKHMYANLTARALPQRFLLIFVGLTLAIFTCCCGYGCWIAPSHVSTDGRFLFGISVGMQGSALFLVVLACNASFNWMHPDDSVPTFSLLAAISILEANVPASLLMTSRSVTHAGIFPANWPSCVVAPNAAESGSGSITRSAAPSGHRSRPRYSCETLPTCALFVRRLQLLHGSA